MGLLLPIGQYGRGNPRKWPFETWEQWEKRTGQKRPREEPRLPDAPETTEDIGSYEEKEVYDDLEQTPYGPYRPGIDEHPIREFLDKYHPPDTFHKSLCVLPTIIGVIITCLVFLANYL